MKKISLLVLLSFLTGCGGDTVGLGNLPFNSGNVPLNGIGYNGGGENQGGEENQGGGGSQEVEVQIPVTSVPGTDLTEDEVLALGNLVIKTKDDADEFSIDSNGIITITLDKGEENERELRFHGLKKQNDDKYMDFSEDVHESLGSYQDIVSSYLLDLDGKSVGLSYAQFGSLYKVIKYIDGHIDSIDGINLPFNEISSVVYGGNDDYKIASPTFAEATTFSGIAKGYAKTDTARTEFFSNVTYTVTPVENGINEYLSLMSPETFYDVVYEKNGDQDATLTLSSDGKSLANGFENFSDHVSLNRFEKFYYGENETASEVSGYLQAEGEDLTGSGGEDYSDWKMRFVFGAKTPDPAPEQPENGGGDGGNGAG